MRAEVRAAMGAIPLFEVVPSARLRLAALT